MPTIIFIQRDGTRREVTGEAGQTLLQAARAHNIDMPGTCDGNLACSTCHVWVEGDWPKRLPAPDDDETDMLDLAIHVKKNSRLGCQIKLTPQLDGLTVRLPPETQSLL
ncbi:MAG: 2Fe-2S iron-sulfur cluster-binding protein [Alphaproteobacteria bacterium]